MSYIIYPQLPSAKLAVIVPTGEISIEQVVEKDVPKDTPYAVVSSVSNIDNDYFDGYIYENGYAVADISKCKSIHLNKFREARVPKLAALDIAFMRAVEQGDAAAQAEIAAQKQALRDVTKIELPNDLSAIKATWPDILKS
jgi:hypothetical protein